jgi:hypothetical protein
MQISKFKLMTATLVLALASVLPAAAQTAPPYHVFLPVALTSRPDMVLIAAEDAFVFQNGPDVNTGNDLLLFAGNDQSEDEPLGIMRSFVRFDLPSVQPHEVKRAVLRIYYAGYGDYPGTNRMIYLASPQAPWSEATLTWANHPARGSDVSGIETNSSAPFGYVEVDLTNQVWRWLLPDGTTPNHGLMLLGTEDAGSDWSYRVFASSESQYPPQLVLTFN